MFNIREPLNSVMTVYPDDDLVRLRLLRRYMSVGIMTLIVSRGGFIVSLFLFMAGGVFISIGRFFFWERHLLYGCRPDYMSSVTSRICPVNWQSDVGSSLDTPTLTCFISGTIALIVAMGYPYALLAVKGNKEESEEMRSMIHLVYQSAGKTRDPSRNTCEKTMLRIVGLNCPSRPWSYFHHPKLHDNLDRRRRLRRLASCLWTEVFARTVLSEYMFPALVAVSIFCNATIIPFLLTKSSIILRICIVFVGFFAYVTTLTVSLIAFSLLLVFDPTAWAGCIVFWCIYAFVHLTCYDMHSWASRIPALIVHNKPRIINVPLSVTQEILGQLF